MVVYPVGGNGGQAQISVPVEVPALGSLTVASNGLMNFRAGSGLAVAGSLQVQGGAMLWLDNSSPPRDLALLGGGTIRSQGILNIYGNNRLKSWAMRFLPRVP